MRSALSPVLLLTAALVPFAAPIACNKSPAEPGASDAGAAADPDAAARAAEIASGNQFHARPRDSKGNLVPRTPPPPITDAEMAPVGSRQPDWDLDPKDPARDYVELYVQSTARYGAETSCVHATASRFDKDRTLVDVRDATGEDPAGTKCKGTNAVRDTFAVDLAKDRLALADPARGKPLANWPDGSDPAGPPAPSPQEADLQKSPLKDKLRAMQLVPLRLQRYGRGSYEVASIAGWHADVVPDASQAQLDDVARRICVVTKGRPVGIFAGMDRQTILRIRCSPNSGRFEKL